MTWYPGNNGPKKKDAASNQRKFDAVTAADELDTALNLNQQAATDAEYIRNLESEIEGLHILVAQKTTLLEKVNTAQQVEIERIKIRLQNESDQQVEKRVAALLSQLLDVDDDLGRAIQASKEMDHNPAVIAGIELVRQSFGTRLQKLGVERMNVIGTVFDPALHDAVSLQSVTTKEEDGTILAVVSDGFKQDKRILREARVVVGKLSA